MKTRNGFVSNSSSTSFIVAVKKDPEAKFDYWTQLKFLVGKKGDSNECSAVYGMAINEYLDKLNMDKASYEKAIVIMEQRLALLKGITKEMSATINALNDVTGITELFWKLRHCSIEEFDELNTKKEDIVQYAIRRQEVDIRYAQKDIGRIEALIKKVEEIKEKEGSEKFRIMDFEVSYQSSGIHDSLAVLEEAGEAFVISKEN